MRRQLFNASNKLPRCCFFGQHVQGQWCSLKLSGLSIGRVFIYCSASTCVIIVAMASVMVCAFEVFVQFGIVSRCGLEVLVLGDMAASPRVPHNNVHH